MSDDDTKLDMSMMYAVHDALRRDLAQICRIAARTDDDPQAILRSAIGWQMFKKFLQIHHTSEDVTVWPVMRTELAGRPDDLALVDAMEAEHAKIDPLLAAIDEALIDRDYGFQRLGDLADALATDLSGHLTHEERDALDLIDATLSPEQWQRFSEDHRARVGDDARTYLPWLLDGGSADRAASVLKRMPEQLLAAYRDEWGPSYARLDLWGEDARPAH
jgi:hemerythrin-like domain-containing protein